MLLTVIVTATEPFIMYDYVYFQSHPESKCTVTSISFMLTDSKQSLFVEQLPSC